MNMRYIACVWSCASAPSGLRAQPLRTSIPLCFISVADSLPMSYITLRPIHASMIVRTVMYAALSFSPCCAPRFRCATSRSRACASAPSGLRAQPLRTSIPLCFISVADSLPMSYITLRPIHASMIVRTVMYAALSFSPCCAPRFRCATSRSRACAL